MKHRFILVAIFVFFSNRLLGLPDFLIIGAQKSGTGVFNKIHGSPDTEGVIGIFPPLQRGSRKSSPP
jgi:hypothetical protein